MPGQSAARHNERVKALALIGVLAVAAGPALAGEIYRWVDEDGRVHYSNRNPEAAPAEEAPPSGEGWESVLERQEGTDEFSRRADVLLNSLNVDLRRARRERDRAREDLEAVRDEIDRLQGLRDARGALDLRPKEADAFAKLQRLHNDVARIEANIERIKEIKAMGRERAERSLGQNPFFQYGQ